RILLTDENIQLVPNNKVVSSEVTNFRIDLSKYIEKKEEEAIQEVEAGNRHSYRETLDEAWRQLKTLTSDKFAYRYTFDINVHMNQDHTAMLKAFDEVCDKWSNEFLTRPNYIVWAKPVAAITYRFSFIVSDPMVIIKRGSDFMKELLTMYYESPQSIQD
ncbi:MAG: hypothetical protein ACFFER_17315, partial [Candidatus Thorarchaeota archaeon]